MAALDKFTKQPYEKFVIAGEFNRVLELGESLTSPTVTSIDINDESDSTADIIETSTIQVDGSQVKVQCKGGVDGETHKITIRTETNLNNKWEVDAEINIEEQ